MKATKPIYVIGHRNPDTDSICSAIGYAHLKQRLGENAIPARAGTINAETKYVLETFRQEPPRLLTDLYPRVKDVMLAYETTVRPDSSLRELGRAMRAHEVKSVPVVDENGVLAGIVTVSDLAKRYFTEMEMQDLAQSGVTLAAVLEVLDGEVVTGGRIDRKITGSVRVGAGSTATIHKVIKENDVVLIGDRGRAMLECIEQNIACLVATVNTAISPEIIAAARQRDVVIISAPYDTYTCARLINQCVPVGAIMQAKVTAFRPTDLLSDVKEVMRGGQFRNYPVVENGRLVGLLGRDQLLVPDKEQVILVDHNERTQAIEGIEEARILEIIDHHRLGGLETSEPIFIRHEPVGCTATIVANMHWRRGIAIPPAIAGLLLSAIVSDTVLFKSPTATPYDRETAAKLAEIAGLDVKTHGLALLKAGSGIGGMSPSEVAKNDLKEFQIGEYKMVVSQLSVMDTAEALAIREALQDSLAAMCVQDGHDMALLMVTDIIREGTYLIFAGRPHEVITAAFGRPAADEPLYLPGVMSRKKQVIPPMVEAARNLEAK